MSNWHFDLISPESAESMVKVMTSDTAEKVSLLLLGVLIAQLVSYLGKVRNKKRLIKSLLEELEQLHSESERISIGYKRQLEIASLGGIEYTYGLPIRAFIFENYYKEIAPDLNKNQRISYQMIHSHIEALNAQIGESKAHLAAISIKETHTAADFNKWSEDLVSGFVATKVLMWHIKYHLSNSKNPSLIIGDATHQKFLQYFQESHDEALSTRSNPPSNVTRQSYEKIYNPLSFGSDYQNIHGERI